MTAIARDWRGAARAIWRDRSGAMTLEASMVLPWIMMLTFVAMLFALFVSQSSVLYYNASVAAERSAFGWSNSAKETRTGAYPDGRYDGLYWRLKDDALLQGFLGLAAGDGAVEVPLGSGGAGAQGASASAKLARIGETVSGSVTGEASYRNIGIKRTVTVRAESSWLPGALADFGVREHAAADVSALVVEPTEFIRTFDLVRYYAEKMRQSPQGETAYRNKAAEVIRDRGAASQ